MSDNSIGLRLQALREEKGLGQEEVAEACGMSRVALTRYENGTRVPQTRYAATLASFYNVTVNYIMGLEEKDSAPQSDSSIRSRLIARLDRLSDKRLEKLLGYLESEDEE